MLFFSSSILIFSLFISTSIMAKPPIDDEKSKEAFIKLKFFMGMRFPDKNILSNDCQIDFTVAENNLNIRVKKGSFHQSVFFVADWMVQDFNFKNNISTSLVYSDVCEERECYDLWYVSEILKVTGDSLKLTNSNSSAGIFSEVTCELIN